MRGELTSTERTDRGARGRLRTQSRARIALAVHGGAGVIDRKLMSARAESAYRTGIAAALTAGHRVLAGGGSSLDAAVAAVCVLEDDPLFNAGRGAVFNAEGVNELDAAVMDGRTLRAGAVTLVTTVKNPVRLARLVLERTCHVMLAGQGAEALAREHGLEIVEPEYFFTQQRWDALRRVASAAKRGPQRASLTEADRHGTVGAVALDAGGNLAAATSTGGRTNKLAGRIGDSPIIGAGTYADNRTVAVSCTGQGECFIRTVAAFAVAALMECKGWSVARAAGHVIRRRLAAIGGEGGMIAIDRQGNIATPFNSAGMHRGWIDARGAPITKVYD